MNKEVKEVIDKELVKHNRHLVIPGIYRHFKEIKDNEEMLYCVSNVSMPLQPMDMIKLNQNDNIEVYMFNHTELEQAIWIFRQEDRYYHPATIEKEMLVIYTALYAGRETYVRPLPMFISLTDKEKYPYATQKYRLELVGGC